MTNRFLRFVPTFLLGSYLLVSFTATSARADDKERVVTPKGRFMSCKLYLDQKVYDKAEQQCRLAVEGDSTEADYHGFWATSLAYLAKQKLEQTAAVSEQSARLDSVRAVAQLYDTARREFENAIRLDPKKADSYDTNRRHFWVELYQLADGRLKVGDFDEALELFKLTTVLDPKDPQGVFQVGFTLSKLDKPLDAVKTVLVSKKMAEERLAELGDCSQLKSGKAKADCSKGVKRLEVIQQNVDSFTKSKNVEIGRSELDAAAAESDAVVKREKLASAIGYLQKGLEQDPTLDGVRFDIADAQFKLGRTYEESDSANARNYYRQAAGTFLIIAENDSSAHDTRKDALFNANMALYQAGEWKRALPLLRKYLDMDPHDTDIWLRIARANSELDNRIEAFSNAMMAHAISDAGEEVPVEESINTIRNLHAQSDAAKALSELGNPEQVRSYRETSDTARVITTWIWWSKGQARHFVDGTQVGAVTFAPQTAAQNTK